MCVCLHCYQIPQTSTSYTSKLCTHHFTSLHHPPKITVALEKVSQPSIYHLKNEYLNLNITYSTQPSFVRAQSIKIAAAEN